MLEEAVANTRKVIARSRRYVIFMTGAACVLAVTSCYSLTHDRIVAGVGQGFAVLFSARSVWWMLKTIRAQENFISTAGAASGR